MIPELAAIRTVRRIVQTDDGQVIPLVDGVNKEELFIIASMLQANGYQPTCATFKDAARASGMRTVWDRVAEQLRPLTQINGVEGVYHGWSDEKTEVLTGHETRNDVFRGSTVTSSAAKYEERYLYPEGVYFVVLSRQDIDTLERANTILEQLPNSDAIDLMYVTSDELPEGAVQLV